MTNILLVEDHLEICDFLEAKLIERGFAVQTVHNGSDALHHIANSKPHLVLLDMDLPIKDGWTVAQELRAHGDATLIIALTAHAMTGDRDRAIEAGCDDYHSKPIDFDKLLEQIDTTLLRGES